jgi:hypothetical protein
MYTHHLGVEMVFQFLQHNTIDNFIATHRVATWGTGVKSEYPALENTDINMNNDDYNDNNNDNNIEDVVVVENDVKILKNNKKDLKNEEKNLKNEGKFLDNDKMDLNIDVIVIPEERDILEQLHEALDMYCDVDILLSRYTYIYIYIYMNVSF